MSNVSGRGKPSVLTENLGFWRRGRLLMAALSSYGMEVSVLAVTSGNTICV